MVNPLRQFQVGGNTIAIASSPRCPGVSYTHARPMPLSIRLGLFWHVPNQKKKHINLPTVRRCAYGPMNQKCQLFCPWNALGTFDRCVALRKCLFQTSWPGGSWKLLVTSQLRRMKCFFCGGKCIWRIVGLMGLVESWNIVSKLSGLCLSVCGGFFLMIMPAIHTRTYHY